MSTGETRAGQAMSTSRCRLRVSDELKMGAKGVVKNTVAFLSVAAAMTQNVPYLGIISGVLEELLKIYNEVEVLKSDWKTTSHITQQIKSVVDNVHVQCETNNLELPKVMVEPLEELELCMLSALETLNLCRAGSKRWRDRVLTVLGRRDLVDKVKQCQTCMQAALDLFVVKLQVDQTINIHAIVTHLRDTKAQLLTIPEPTAAITISTSLPVAPAIFHGRTQEVNHALHLLIDSPPARIAFSGPGGIGKTSIALTVMHHPDIEILYGDRRFFVACEAASSADGIVQEVLKMFGLVAEKGKSPQDVLLLHMCTLSDGLLCLDNLETPWDNDKLAVESLLARITALPRFALLVTTRGADRPLHVVWTQPFLPQIRPFKLEAALKTWNAICGSHNGHAKQLIRAVDCVPLAVTLLAHLAESESSEILWARWQCEQTELLRARGPDHRLSSVDISIQLSLHGPRLQDEETTVQLFSVLCTFPQGLRQSRTTTFAEAYANHFPNIPRSLGLLKQCALLFTTEDGFLRVLSPVRHYMQTHHPISSVLFTSLSVIYRDIVRRVPGDWAAQAAYARENIQPELGNISAVLELCLTREVKNLAQTAEGIIALSRLSTTLFFHDTKLLSEAITHCSKHGLRAVEAKLWHTMGTCLYYQASHQKSLAAHDQALQLHRFARNTARQAECLGSIGKCHLALGQHREAERSLLLAHSLCGKGERMGKASCLRYLGNLYVKLNRLDEAEQALLHAKSIYDAIGERLGQANILRSLGNLYMQINRFNEAEHALLSAQNLSEEIGDRLGRLNCMLFLGRLYTWLARVDEAESALMTARCLHDELEGGLSTDAPATPILPSPSTDRILAKNSLPPDSLTRHGLSKYDMSVPWSHERSPAHLRSHSLQPNRVHAPPPSDFFAGYSVSEGSILQASQGFC